MAGVGRWLLLAVVGFYRRKLSKRGPFAKVRCTFEGLESCSAYGERVAAESSPLVAVLRIYRRLRRCHHLSLYRLDGGRLGWGRDYDATLTSDEAVRRLDEALGRDGEGEAVRAAVMRSAQLLGMRSGSLGAIQAPRLLLRDASAVRRACTRRLWVRLVAATMLSALAVGAVMVGTPIVASMLLFTCVMPLPSAIGSWRMLRRLDWLAVLAAIDGPDGCRPAPSSRQ